MKLKNTLFFIILFVILFLFLSYVYIDKEMTYRNEVRESITVNPIFKIEYHYDDYLERNGNKINKTIIKDKVNKHTEGEKKIINKFKKIFYKSFKYKNNLLSDKDFCFVRFDENLNYKTFDCSNFILSRYINLNIEENKENWSKKTLNDIKNKKIKLYFEKS